MKKVAFLILFSLLLCNAETLIAQCAMCRRTAETSYNNENNVTVKRGKSLNKGILYLLSVPYIIGAVGAFMWYKNRKRD
jgi:hypothetical protein